MNPYLTIYRKDYVPKKAMFPITITSATQEFEDPINEGFKKHLDLDNPTPPDPNQYVDDFKEEFCKDHKKIEQIHFSSPLDKQIIKDEESRRFLTTTKEHYVYSDEQYQDPFSLIDATLPDDWVIPETTQRIAYRDPKIYSAEALGRQRAIWPINNLGPSETVNEILQVATGDTEYMGVIGALGGLIVEEQMHGKIVHE